MEPWLDGDPDPRRSALADVRFQDLPVSVALAALTTWGDANGASAPARDAIADLPATGSVSAGSTLTVGCYLAVVDDAEADDAARTAARLAQDSDDLVSLEDALLSSDDESLQDVGDQATLLSSA